MRLTRIAAATLIAGSLTVAGGGVALADTVTPTVGQVASSSAAASEPGTLSLSSTSVKPGQHINFSGSFAEPAASTATGSITVTSSAFSGPATMDRTMPEAFDGSATIASGVRPGTYTVTASSSAGTVSARLTVVGTTPHGGGTGTHTSGHGSSSGSSSTDGTGGSAIGDITDAGSDLVPWVLGGAGAVVLIGGGAYVLGRGRSADREVEARRQYREPRTEVMPRR